MKTGWTGLIFAVVLLALPATGFAQGKAGGNCLSQREAIAAVQSGRAVPLGQVRAVAEDAGRGEVIKADLCMRGDSLAYVLTVLGGNGRVVTAIIEASTGRLASTR